MKKHKSPKDKIVFLDGFYNNGDSYLVLYKGTDEQYPILQSFMEAGIKDNELCVYTFPREPDELKLERHFESHVNQFHRFPLIRGRRGGLKEEHITALYSKLMELGRRLNSEGYNALRLAIDFGDLLSSANFEVLDYLEEDSRRCREKFPISQLYALDIDSVDQEILGRLVGLYDRMVISVGDGSMVCLPKSSTEEPSIPSIDVMSHDTIEQCVKSSLDVIVLSLLQREPMCGFDVIKAIVQRFDILLSQGVVYPLLYSFKEQGYLRTETKPDNKTRVYIPTETGTMEMKGDLRYRIGEGDIYLVEEKKLNKGVDVFLDLLSSGYSGMVISRSRPEKIRELCKVEVPILWLSEEVSDKRAVYPELRFLEKIITDYATRNRVVLLDRLDYLVVKTSFKEVLGFIQRLNELFYRGRGVLIISMDPDTLSAHEYSLLEKETNEVKLRAESNLPEDLLEILGFVSQQNALGKKPSQKEITKQFNVTRTTARKRINRLGSMELVRGAKKGRYKVLELTEKGITLWNNHN